MTDALVLDVFAGTGAFGLEAMSHEAAHTVFIENDAAAAACCQKNIAAFNLGAKTLLMKNSATTFPPLPANILPRTLVFLDPPYGKNLGAAALKSAAEKHWLAPDAVCVLEMAKKEPEPEVDGFEIQDERIYGIALMRFMIFKSA